MASEGCLNVVVQEENVVETVSVVGLVLSGIFGLILGAVIGFIVFKCFLSQSHCCFGSHAIGVGKRKTRPTSQANLNVTYENINEESDRLDQKNDKESESDDEIVQRRTFFVLHDFITDITWDKMIFELGKQELIELMRLELSTWEERRVCLLQLYRCTMNQLFSDKLITRTQYHEILVKEEKSLSAAAKRMKDQWEMYIRNLTHFSEQSLIDSFGPFQENYSQTIKNMIAEYRHSMQRFSATVSQHVKDGRASDALENLYLQTDAVEGFFRENQDEVIESVRAVFQKFGSIVRELVITLICEAELNRLLSATCDISLEKLVKTGRISSETKESVRDSLPEDYDISRDELKDVFSQMHPNIMTHYHSLMQQREQESAHALQSILIGYESQTSSEGFVQGYLSASCEKKLQRMALLRDFAETEHSGIGTKLEQMSQIQDRKRFEAIQIFCKQLESNDALSRAELHQMRQDFVKKLDTTRGKVFTTCRRNITELWRLYDQHCKRQQEEENRVDASILQDSVTDNLVSLEGFLHSQTNLTPDDQQIILQERESLFLILINQINTFRAKWFHVIENDLAKCQAFLLVKKRNDLVNDTIPEILGIIERLWTERNSMKEYVRETAALSSMKSILAISNEEMCKILSRRLVKNLLGKQLMDQTEKTLQEDIEKALVREISARNTFSNFAAVSHDHNEKLTRLVKGELDKHDFNMSVIEDDVGAALLKRQGRLKTKAQRIAQHAPPSAANIGDIQPFLEQLLLQNQVSRAIDSAESESIQQNLMVSQIADRTTSEKMTKISRDSDVLLLAKFAILSGLTKSEFAACVSHAKNKIASEGRGRWVSQKFHKIWKEALAYVESI